MRRINKSLLQRVSCLVFLYKLHCFTLCVADFGTQTIFPHRERTYCLNVYCNSFLVIEHVTSNEPCKGGRKGMAFVHSYDMFHTWSQSS
jgi:hypothetical protein